MFHYFLRTQKIRLFRISIYSKISISWLDVNQKLVISPNFAFDVFKEHPFIVYKVKRIKEINMQKVISSIVWPIAYIICVYVPSCQTHFIYTIKHLQYSFWKFKFFTKPKTYIWEMINVNQIECNWNIKSTRLAFK